ncbi:increased loss of mitochondrial DNA protein 1 [Scheffersomyces xylosifermentans]|uniref:increased loss of mitochondrial DNA protein 1 n=1 Tax=Scheffersomyces xylosifermentans TaxID=1304137 RepID=UPI00315C5437
MQFLTATSLLYIRVVFLLTIAFFLVRDPEKVGGAGFVVLLGQAMQVPIGFIKAGDPLLGILAVVFSSLAIGDVIPLLANNIDYFETVVPTRLAFFFGLAAYAYLINDSVLSNALIITYSFLEIWFNFLIFNNLRDEKYYRMKTFIEENAEAIQRAQDEQVRVVELDQ